MDKIDLSDVNFELRQRIWAVIGVSTVYNRELTMYEAEHIAGKLSIMGNNTVVVTDDVAVRLTIRSIR